MLPSATPDVTKHGHQRRLGKAISPKEPEAPRRDDSELNSPRSTRAAAAQQSNTVVPAGTKVHACTWQQGGLEMVGSARSRLRRHSSKTDGPSSFWGYQFSPDLDAEKPLFEELEASTKKARSAIGFNWHRTTSKHTRKCECRPLLDNNKVDCLAGNGDFPRSKNGDDKSRECCNEDHDWERRYKIENDMVEAGCRNSHKSVQKVYSHVCHIFGCLKTSCVLKLREFCSVCSKTVRSEEGRCDTATYNGGQSQHEK